jgi:hypothetical protein
LLASGIDLLHWFRAVVTVIFALLLNAGIPSIAQPQVNPDAPSPAPSPSPSPSPSPTPPAPSVEDLYRTILPRPIGEPEGLPAEDAAAEPATPSGDGERDGLYLGRVRFTPSLHASYVIAEGALLDTAAPVDDRYYELRPRIGAEAPLSTGFLRGEYQAAIRRESSFDQVNDTVTHLADLSFDLPLASVEITGSEHFARGLLETAEVDPGREYFFGLGRFTRHVHALGLRLFPGGLVDATIAGSLAQVRVDDRSTFFSHDQQSASARLGYEVRPAVRLGLGYGFTRVPAVAERPEAESRAHSASAELFGEILPLTNASVSVGYTTQTNPAAGPGGERYSGLTASGRIEKSFTPSSSLTLSGSRSTQVSSFERNGFYVTTAGQLMLRAAAPWSLAVDASAGYHRNDYRTIASSIGTPRRDALAGWSLGIARPFTRHAFVRADYRRERRDSNIDLFDSRSSVLSLQIGIGMFGSGPGAR